MVENIVNVCPLLSIGLEHSADQVLGNCKKKSRVYKIMLI